MKKTFTLTEHDHGEERRLFTGTLAEVVDCLQKNEDWFNWILDEGDKIQGILNAIDWHGGYYSYKFDNIKILQDLKDELEKVDLSWWKINIEKPTPKG